MSLMESYKKEPNTNEKLKEKNPKWLNDDYVKFIRFSQHLIEKNGEGILAFINPHGFLDNPTFRGMRWQLLKCFDKIYTIDLHGNSKKKETAPNGEKDENVFDIQQGVSINFFVKTGKKKTEDLAQVFHCDLFGKREKKYEFLWENSLGSIGFKVLTNQAPNYFFVPKNFDEIGEYEKGFSVAEIFTENSVGVVTARDAILINDNEEGLLKNVEKFYQKNAEENLVKKISYRPFDEKFIYYNTKLVERPREKVMQHFLAGENWGLSLCKQFKTGENYFHSFLTNQIIESSFVSNKTSEITSLFPLYLYNQEPQTTDLLNQKTPSRQPNLNAEIIKKISQKLGLEFAPDHELKGTLTPALSPQGRGSCIELEQTTSPLRGEGWGEGEKMFSPLDLLDYIYAVLHSPNYREKYKEFLKIDFPRIPYPQDQNSFWQLVKLGENLRKNHLLENDLKLTTAYPCEGSNQIDKIKFESGKVWINDRQFFEGISVTAWEFFIGGYQVAQKWLKDRKGKILGFEEILHYQKIIAALDQTALLMKEIDQVFTF
jgi:predicted helicase